MYFLFKIILFKFLCYLYYNYTVQIVRVYGESSEAFGAEVNRRQVDRWDIHTANPTTVSIPKNPNSIWPLPRSALNC